MINIKLENQPALTNDLAYGTSSSSKISPALPSLKKAEASIIEELFENSSRQDLRISTDVPSFRELGKVAANNKSNYIHAETNTVFPHLIEDFERFQLIASVTRPGEVDVIYKSQKNNSTFTVTLSPGGEAVEGRLRGIYLTGIKQLSKELGKNYLPQPAFLKFRGTKYICNGVQGIYVNDEKSFSQFNAFECGSWILGTKIIAEETSEADFNRLKQDLISYFNPARLTALKPMNLKPNVDFMGDAMKDTMMIGALFGSAVKKINWADENVSEKESYSGFPDIYLNMHVDALKEFLKIIRKKPNRSKVHENANFYTDLNSIDNAGFLPEFIMEAYENVMIVPPSIDLDMNSFYNWKRDRELKVDLLKKRYKINYRALPY